MAKRLFIMLLPVLFAFTLHGQTYVGTMTIGNYTQHQVKVDLATAADGTATLTLHGVKFARMMPVKLDVTIAPVASKDGTLRADGVVPTAKGKRYEKYTVRRLQGSAGKKQLQFRCQMGKKELVVDAKR